MSTPDPVAAAGGRAIPAGTRVAAAPDPSRAVSPAAADAPGRGPVSVRVAQALLAHPSVAALSGGPFGTVATYLPGRRQPGVVIGVAGEPTRVAVALRFGIPVATTAAELRAIVAVETGAQRVDVLVTDLVMPGTTPHDTTTRPDPGAAPGSAG